MSNMTFKGSPIQTVGNFPQVGQAAPNFKVLTSTLEEVSLSDFKGKKIILNVFPSVDTPACNLQLKKFNKLIAQVSDTVLLFISLDLPFAFKRFCADEGIDNAITASDFRYNSIGESYGVQMKGGLFDGLYARAVLILNEDHTVVYSDMMQEVTTEPNYDEVMVAAQALV